MRHKPNPQGVIDSVTYEGAKKYYRDLKKQLFNYIEKIAGSETANLFMDGLTEMIHEKLDQRINGKNLVNDIAFKRLPDKIEEVIYKELENNSSSQSIQQAKSEYLSKKNLNTERGSREAKKILQNVVEELNKTNTLVTFLKRQNKLSKNAVDFSDIKNQLPAFQRAVVKEYFETGMQGGGRKGGNLATVSGYYEESIIADAIYNYLTQLGISARDFTAKQVGSVSVDGRDTPYDILMGAIFGNKRTQLSRKLENLNGIIDIDSSLNSFGIQSKRFSLPTRFVYKEDLNKDPGSARLLKKYSGTSTAFKIGSRGKLHEEYLSTYGKDKNYHWTTALEFLGSTENVKESLGSGNVMWVAGNEAMWTSDFIEIFTNNKMRLNFEYLIETKQKGSGQSSYKAYKGNNLIVLAYHNANLRYALINN